MHPSIPYAACCGLLAALAACGGGGASLPPAAAADPAASVARAAPPALPLLQDLGAMSYAAPGLTAGAPVALAPLQSGGFALAWLKPGTGGLPATVQVQEFNSRGQPLDGVAVVTLDRPLATAGLGLLADGTLVVAFVEVTDDPVAFTETRALRLARYDRKGRLLDAPTLVTESVRSLMAPSGPAGEVRVVPTRDGGFALAWVDAAAEPGYPQRLWAEVELFSATGAPLAPATVLDPRLLPSPRPDLGRVTPLPDTGVFVPRLFSGSTGLAEDWLPLGNPARTASVPAGAYPEGGLAAAAQVVPLEGGGYVALQAGALQLYGNDGLPAGTPVPVTQGGRLLALAGGGFLLLGWDGSVQAYDASAQPLGATVQAALGAAPQAALLQALAGGAVAIVVPQDGWFSIDLLAPTR